ncbi:MAG TPA: hypothetical protein VF665_09705 [Longimicrobium sp.]|uniref:hypothetical protein n=1 Tax=Longimicrobium sp. TaxID=2029185 RepID=UPI002EDB04D8
MRATLFAVLAFAACAPAASGPAPSPSPRSGGSTGATGGENTQVVLSGESMTVSTASEFRLIAAEVAAPVDRVWAVLPAVYQELGLTASADAPRRTVAARNAVVNRRFQGRSASQFFDCGTGQFGAELAAQNEIRMDLQTTVQPGSTAGTSRLETGLRASARASTGANALMAVCHTRQTMEALVAERVRAKLGLGG